MADYKLDCCGGYPNHRSGCISWSNELDASRKRKAEQKQIDRAWENFFSSMSDEELFAYTDNAWKQLDKARKWDERRSRALSYMRDKYKSQKFLEWRRNR